MDYLNLFASLHGKAEFHLTEPAYTTFAIANVPKGKGEACGVYALLCDVKPAASSYHLGDEVF